MTRRNIILIVLLMAASVSVSAWDNEILHTDIRKIFKITSVSLNYFVNGKEINEYLECDGKFFFHYDPKASKGNCMHIRYRIPELSPHERKWYILRCRAKRTRQCSKQRYVYYVFDKKDNLLLCIEPEPKGGDGYRLTIGSRILNTDPY